MGVKGPRRLGQLKYYRPFGNYDITLLQPGIYYGSEPIGGTYGYLNLLIQFRIQLLVNKEVPGLFDNSAAIRCEHRIRRFRHNPHIYETSRNGTEFSSYFKRHRNKRIFYAYTASRCYKVSVNVAESENITSGISKHRIFNVIQL